MVYMFSFCVITPKITFEILTKQNVFFIFNALQVDF